MTSTREPLRFELQPPRGRRPRWRRALRAARALIRDEQRTELAFEVQTALDPDLHERTLRHMLAHPEGRRLFRERPSLRAALSDRAALAALPEGSLGRAYLDHIDRYGLEPGKLVALGSRYAEASEQADPDLHWVAERSQLSHDLWHVLTGYGADGPGESALLLFSYAQTGSRSSALLGIAANFEIARRVGPRWLRTAWRAYLRGRSAVCLAVLPFEALLPLPLAEVRAAAGIEAQERAHPAGVAAA